MRYRIIGALLARLRGETCNEDSRPADTVFTQQILTVEQQECSVCGHDLTICDHRYHHIYTLNGPLAMICKLAHCPDRSCAAHSQILSPLAETPITLP